MKQFRHRIVVAAVATGIAVAAPRPAHADVIPIRAKIGLFFPQGGARDIAGSTNPMGEIDFGIPNLGQGKYYVSLGYSDSVRSGSKLRMIPVTVSRMFSPPNPAGKLTGNVYYGVGVGVYSLHASGGGITPDSATHLGGFLQAGYQFPNPYFVEAKYHLTGKVADKTVQGFALMVGRHF